MGVFSRISDIVNSNINAILDRAQDPEKIIRLIIQEMEDTLVEVRSSTVKTIAEKRELERRIAGLAGEIDEWQGKAELALSKDREDLAKGALQIKARLKADLALLEKQLVQIEEGLAKQSDDVVKLQQKLADAKAREASMAMRHTTASARLKIRSTLYDERVTDAFSRFEQVERALDELEGKVDVYDIGVKKTVAEELAELEATTQVENELNALKEKLAKKAEGSN
ncbi:phage shock protein PspA [Aliidongia dinghuensis]|uniref:Phage shock protein PspA n=1 Tax=Aliidongia dinghuensis TaxID=1867774 RepID=A0A8J3E720_9PROT|nr:phage shock protein PspA [Aliidongia dinghuensis]GGF50041.1 phage shock protein PspA [Aliidongia dinghuensis]